MERIYLNNGLNVFFYQMSNTNSVTISLYVKTGSICEEFEGITHLLEHLHFRKLGKFSQEELYYKMECMGSSLRATTYRDFIKFSMKVIPEKCIESIEIFQNLITNDDWNDDDYEKEKKVVLNQIDECGEYISIEKAARKVIFGNHTLSKEIMGTRKKIEALKIEDVQKCKSKLFTSKNLLLCITGNMDAKVLTSILNKMEEIRLPVTEEECKLAFPNLFHHRKPDIVFREVQDSNPLDVNMSFDITYNKDSKDLLTIVNCILGEGVGSKLQKKVREEKGYSSNIASYIEWYQGFAVLNINFSVKRQFLLECMREIVSILKEMKTSISTKDLEVTLPFYTTNQAFYEDDTEEMNFQLAYNHFILGMEFGSVELKNDEKTKVALQEISKKIFELYNLCVVVVGNTKAITKKSIVQILKDI